jgi:hypothetical protein
VARIDPLYHSIIDLGVGRKEGDSIGQTVANETGDIFGSISEGLKGFFGMK